MRDEPKPNRERLTTSILAVSFGVGVALLASAIVWPCVCRSLPALQLLGIVLTALGFTAVWSLLERLAEKTLEARRQLERCWTPGRERLRL